MPRTLLNTKQAAAELGVSPGLVRQWYLDGTLVPEPKEPGSRDRYVRADRVQRLKRAREKNPPRVGRPWPSRKQDEPDLTDLVPGLKANTLTDDVHGRARLVATG